MDFRLVYFLAVLGLVQCKLIKLKCVGIKKFVDEHNSKRLGLASGTVNGQPAASKMNSMMWDKELAEKAAEWASKNVFSHNPDRKISSNRFEVGENIYQFGTTDHSYKLDPGEPIKSWFDEQEHYQYKQMEWDDFSESSYNTGHYTQIAWSNSIYVGCAISEFFKDEWKYFNVVCNYGPGGNFIGQAPYECGEPSNQLSCGAESCDRLYGNSC